MRTATELAHEMRHDRLLGAKSRLQQARYQKRVDAILGVNALSFYGDEGVRFERDGFVFHLHTRIDDMGDGIFTDRWQPNAVSNPDWRPKMSGYDSVYRYWIPEGGMTQREIADGLSRYHGMSRHEAWTTAGESLIEELKAARNGSLIVIVHCYRNDVKLGSASIATNYFENDVYECYSVAEESGLFDEAKEEAEAAIAAMGTVEAQGHTRIADKHLATLIEFAERGAEDLVYAAGFKDNGYDETEVEKSLAELAEAIEAVRNA